MGPVDDYMPAVAMFGLQITYAVIALTSRAALLQGMSPRVFVVYRQAIATAVVAPIAYFSRSKSGRLSLDLRSFSLIFIAALVGVTINQNVYIEGIYLATSSMATAMTNLVPAVTFLIAAIVGLERVDITSWRSIAKIGGTVVCVSGAMGMALLRGPKLLNAEHFFLKSVFGVESDNENWLLGCLCLLASCCCWSVWLILQVPASASYPDHLSLSAWMCFFATIQSAIVTLLLEPSLEAWKLHSNLELVCYLFSGIVGSGIAFFVQAWCISRRGPVFSALFNPLCTIIVTILAALFLHEPIYTGSLLGGVAVIIGLYIVLWGKANETSVEEEASKQQTTEEEPDREASGATSCKNDLEEPFLFKAHAVHSENWPCS